MLFAEINVICLFSTCQKLCFFSSVVYCIFMTKHVSITLNNHSLFNKSRMALLLLHTELLGKKDE